MRSAGSDPLFELGNYNNVLGGFLNVAFLGSASANMAKAIDDPNEGCRLVAVDPIALDGHACFRLRMERIVPGTGYNMAVTIDPELGWAKRRVESYAKPGKNDYDVAIEYDLGPGGMPVPHVVTSRQLQGVVKTCKFKTFSSEPTSLEEFTLPFYGLPPVDGRVVTQGRRPIWLAGLGVGGLGLAYGIRRNGKSRKTRSESA